MEESFKLFYNSLDTNKFKYFIKNNIIYVYDTDIDYLPVALKPKTDRAVKIQDIELIIKDLLINRKVPVEEYTENTLTKRGFPGDYLDFIDICISDAIPPTIFSVLVSENNTVSVAFIQDSKIMESTFQDDDLFSNLYSFSSTFNCIQFLYCNKAIQRVFNSWGINCLLVKFTSAVEMIKTYMKVDFKVCEYVKEDSCLVNIADFDIVDFKCVTQQGKRLINQWIRSPSKNKDEINQRLDLSEAFMNININLNRMVDLKRTSTRIYNRNITINEVIKLCEVIDQIPDILQEIQAGKNSRSTRSQNEAEERNNYIKKIRIVKECFISPLENLKNLFDPLLFEVKNKINFKRSRVHCHLSDSLISLDKLRQEILEEVESEFIKVKKQFPKVSFSNKMFKISRLDYNQSEFDTKKYVVVSLLKTGAQFVTKKLSDLNEKLEKNEKEIFEAESQIFEQIKTSLVEYINAIDTFNFLVALMDVYKAFSSKVGNTMYSRPIFHDSLYQVSNVFHPMLEYKGAILNDISFDRDLCILTGPNMGGKSTFIKSLSMVSLYAQIGCYVPATSAILPIFDRIFLRVGARDCSSQRMSTFMVEMSDLNKIVRTATSKSLILIDELGRGTSAIDGLSLVLAVKKYLIKLGAKTLIATHFSQVGDENTLNKKMCVEGSTLTYKIEDGVCDTSFGIKVAELARFPTCVLEKAKYYLQQNAKN